MSVSFLLGHNFAHGYSVSSHAGVLDPQSSSQLSSGAPLNNNQVSVGQRDEMQGMRHQNSPQHEPVHHENNEAASSVVSLSEEMDSGHEPVPSPASVKKYDQENSENQHPFNVLVRGHKPRKSVEGVTFATIKDFKQFIETLKRSFLMPGSDVNRHFQTAREVLRKEIAHNAQREADAGYRSNSTNAGAALDDASESQAWTEPMNAAFESEQGVSYETPSESLSVLDPVDATANLLSNAVYDDPGPGSALYPAAPEHVTSDYGSLYDSPHALRKGPDVLNEVVQSTSYKFPGHTPPGFFAREHFSFPGHVTESPVNTVNHPPPGFTHVSSETSNIMPQRSEWILQPQAEMPHSEEPVTEYREPYAASRGEEVGKKTAAGPSPSKSYGKSVRVSLPRSQLSVPPYLPRHRERPAPSFLFKQPTDGSKSRDLKYTPTFPQPASSGSASSSSGIHSPQSSSDYVEVQTSNPSNAWNQDDNSKQPVSAHRVVNVKHPDSSSYDGYLRDQIISATHPSPLTGPKEDVVSSDLFDQNPVSSIQEPQQIADNSLIPISGGSAQRRIPSPVDYASLKSLSNLAPTTDSQTAFSRSLENEVTFRNFGTKNMLRFPTVDRSGRNGLDSFILSKKRSLLRDVGRVGGTKASPLRFFMQPNKLWKHRVNMKKELGNVDSHPLKLFFTSKAPFSTFSGDLWRRNSGNTKSLLSQTDPRMSSPSANMYSVKSRSGYARRKGSLSKTHYVPYQLDDNYRK